MGSFCLKQRSNPRSALNESSPPWLLEHKVRQG